MTQYTDQTYFILKFAYFCYNYDRDMLHEAFRKAAKADGINTEYHWDKFIGKVQNSNPEKNIDSQYAVLDMLLEIGSVEGRNAFVKYIMDNYKGV